MPTKNKNTPTKKGIARPKTSSRIYQKSWTPDIAIAVANIHIMLIKTPTHVKTIPITVLFIKNSLSKLLIYAFVFACCNSTIWI